MATTKAVYALALLPAGDAVARVELHGHRHSDVLAGVALGTGIGGWSGRCGKSPVPLAAWRVAAGIRRQTTTGAEAPVVVWPLIKAGGQSE